MSENDTPKENSNKENITYYNTINILSSIMLYYINIVLTPFKIGSLFSSKDRLPNALRCKIYISKIWNFKFRILNSKLIFRIL